MRRHLREELGIDHRPVDADPHVAAVARRHDAAEAGAEAARHAGLERELCRHAAFGAQRPDRLEHRRRPAGVDRRMLVLVEGGEEQVGDEAVVAGAAVVGRDARVGEQRRARGVGGVAEAEQRRRRAAGGEELVVPDRQRRGPDPAAAQQRPAAVAGRGEAEAERAGEPQRVAGPQRAQPRRPGADVLEHELEPARPRPQGRERARQERPLVLSPAPALRRGEHEELARTGRRAVRVGDLEDDVGAELAARGHLERAPAEGGERAAAHVAARSRARPPCSSCSDSTGGAPCRAAEIARAAASPPESVVRHGIPAATAARRISQPSVRAPDPVGVLTMRSTSPRSIQSTTCGEAPPTLLIRSAGMPIRSIASAVPRVATIRKPRSCSVWATATAPGLSLSVTVMNAVPESGSAAPAAAWALANAVGKSRATPITSPVERISGPRRASAPSKRSNGSTASLTEMWPARIGSSGRSRSARRSPSITRQATLASGIPIALDTNGTVRDARGLASMTYSSPPSTAYWTFRRPTTPSPRAIPAVHARIWSSIAWPSECGGSTHAESPEWMPASSTCCMIPPIQTSSPSQIASTSTSIAFSRKRSRKISRPLPLVLGAFLTR